MIPSFIWPAMLTLVAAAALARGRTAVRGTTLMPAWRWTVAATMAVAAAACAEACANAGTAIAPLRYFATILPLAPGVAVLGAKRPQAGPWQWIVLTLLVILALPGLEVLLLHPGSTIAVHPARMGFMIVVAAVAVGNYLPTRHALAALLAGAGEALALAGHAPLETLALLVAALGIAAVDGRWSRRGKGWNRAWLDFRDAYGVVWALRIAERFNAAAASHGRSLRIGWRGIGSTDHAASSTAVDERILRMLLLRFVSSDWIAGRLVESQE